MLTRRTLVVNGLRASALIPTLPLLGAAPPQAGREDKVLVVVQLSGGNDGLNTVIPMRQDNYWRLRPHLGLAKARMHPLNDDAALHPSMAELAGLYHEGQVAVLQGVGLPKANRSHFRSMDIWHTASFDQPVPSSGWLGRLADRIAGGTPGSLPALAIGGGELPLSLRADRVQASAVRDASNLRLEPRANSIAAARDALLEGRRGGNLKFLADTARASYGTAARLAALDQERSAVDYPGTALAKGFATVAQLVAAGLGCRLFHLNLEGFDTHARQAPIHADRLAKLSGALGAFQRDLGARGIADRVRTLVFSEFGRRAQENGSKGTDHGHGAPAFVIGKGVAGGLHGKAPDLDALVDGDVPATQDFRGLYATLESDWMGVPSAWEGERVAL